MLSSRPQLLVVASNAAWLILDRFVRLVLALTMGAWVARHLGPAQFGELSYAISLIAFFQGIVNLGADGIAVRDIARNPSKAPLILGTLLRLRLACGVVCWGGAVALVYVLRPGDFSALVLVALIGTSLVLQCAETVDLWFQSQYRNKNTVKAKLLAYLVANCLRVGFLINDAPLWTFALAAAIDAAVLATSLAFAYRRMPTSTGWRMSGGFALSLLRESWPFMVSSLAALLYMRIDQIMIRHLLGEVQLGIYAAAMPVSQVWQVVPVTAAVALAPYITKKKAEGQAPYTKALSQAFRVTVFFSLAVTAGTTLAAPWIIVILYGHAYVDSALVLAVHVWSNIFIALGVIQGLWLITEGLGRLTLYRTVLGAGICIVGNWYAIPRYGLVGAAWVNVVSQFVAAVGSNAIWAPQMLRMQVLAFIPGAKPRTLI
jgi:O-antigen/teichoic acid export membrane protein